MDSLTSASCAEKTQADPADTKDKENADNGTHEEAGERSSAETGDSEKKPEMLKASGEKDEEEDEDSVIDGDSSATSSASNRFTVLSEDQHSKDSVLEDEKMSDMDQEAEEEEQLAGEMQKMALNDAFVEDAEGAEGSVESEDTPLEAKEYTVVNQDPELAFHTLAARTAPEKQECSVQSCLFQFTEVETLTHNNSLLCVTCTKRQPHKSSSQGICCHKSHFSCIITLVVLYLRVN